MKSLIITAQSAWTTLLICDRQARKDTAKVIKFSSTVAAVLTSRQAVQTYRMIWNAFTICCMVAIACGASAREFLDGYVEDCLEQEAIANEAVPTVEEVAKTLVVTFVEDVRKVVEAIASMVPQIVPAAGQVAGVILGAIAIIYRQ